MKSVSSYNTRSWIWSGFETTWDSTSLKQDRLTLEADLGVLRLSESKPFYLSIY